MTRTNQAGIFDIFDQARRVGEFLPLISLFQRFMGETDPGKRAIVIGDVFEWIASKTQTKLDDKYVAHLQAFLESTAGAALVRDLVDDLSPKEAQS